MNGRFRLLLLCFLATVSLAWAQFPPPVVEAGPAGGSAAEELSKQGLLWFSQGERETALDAFERALAIDPKLVQAHLGLGLVLLDLKDPDRAAAEFSKVIELAPNSTDAFNASLLRGKALADKERWNEAIASVSQALAIKPRDAGAFHTRGKLRESKGDLEGAIADFTRALEILPKAIGFYTSRAAARKAAGHVDGAIADYSSAIELNPKHSDYLVDRGIAHKTRGDLEAAISDFDGALALAPASARAFANRGLARLLQGRESEAQKDLDRALELDGSLKAALEQEIIAAKSHSSKKVKPK